MLFIGLVIRVDEVDGKEGDHIFYFIFLKDVNECPEVEFFFSPEVEI